jgi:multidrug resistance efflux pump
MKPSRIVLINVVILVVLLLAAGAALYYTNQSQSYVSTDDAAISAPTVPVAAVVTGSLQSVAAKVGEHVTQGETLATVLVATAAAHVTPAAARAKGSVAPSTPATVAVTAPVAGTVAQVDGVKGELVGPGSPLFAEVELGGVYVTANIPETQIQDVKVHQTVDITVDAQPGVTLAGHVTAIEPATESYFSLIPTAATAGSYTKVEQRVPVLITVETAGYTLLPGENCEVRIHLN